MMRSCSVLFLGLTLLSSLPLAAYADEDRARAIRRTPVVEVFEKCRDAVVNISTTRVVQLRRHGPGSIWDELFPMPRGERAVQSVGSGVVIHPSGYVVTNAHVVARADDVQVTFADNRTAKARRIAVDTEHDLAVLKIDGAHAQHCVPMGRSDDIMVGETVVAIGNPLGLQHTVTAGIVSALGRELQISPDVAYRGLIQTDTPINPGNSGGPLLNVNGELIGINTAIRGDAQNIGFAIPVDRLWELLPDLLDIEQTERVRFGLRVGGHDVRVLEVRPDTPAARADIKPDDRIVKVNGKPIGDAIDYYVQLREQKPDTDVRLEVQRGASTLEKKVPLQSIPLPNGAELAEKLFGVQLDEVSPDSRRRMGLNEDIGLVVRGVAKGSPAERAGIARGDYLVQIGRIYVSDLDQLGLLLEQVRPGDRARVEYVRVEGDWLIGREAILTARGR
jgi:serine protease Do